MRTRISPALLLLGGEKLPQALALSLLSLLVLAPYLLISFLQKIAYIGNDMYMDM